MSELPREQLKEWATRADKVTAEAACAFARLLSHAEQIHSGQARRVAGFIHSVMTGTGFDIYKLRTLDVELSDDVLLCLDAIRWGKLALWDLVPSSDVRAQRLLQRWGILSTDAGD